MRYKLLNSDGVVRQVDAQWVGAAENIAITSAIVVSEESGMQGSGSDQEQSVSDTLCAGYAMIEFQSVGCLLYTSPSPRDGLLSRMPSSA